MHCPKHEIEVAGCSRQFNCQNCLPETLSIPTPEQIKAWVFKTIYSSRCGTPIFFRWDKKLWQKHSSEIIDYLTERFENTLFEEEYYLSMLYLRNELADDELYVPFQFSPQVLNGNIATCLETRLISADTGLNEADDSSKRAVSKKVLVKKPRKPRGIKK